VAFIFELQTGGKCSRLPVFAIDGRFYLEHDIGVGFFKVFVLVLRKSNSIHPIKFIFE
jgi:hypothetical protein